MDDNTYIDFLKEIRRAYYNGEIESAISKIYDVIEAYDLEQSKPKCTCGCTGDPGCCGHSPSCPMKSIEG